MSAQQVQDLILVPGHGVCLPGKAAPSLALLDSSWAGIFPGEGGCYVEHIRAGVALAHDNPAAALVFSGGQTRMGAGERSEAESYREIAMAAGWWGCPEVETRAIAEDYARDSLENLLFAVARFRQVTNRWPRRIRVVGWRFKAQRFDLHRQALGWPANQFAYVGVNDPEGTTLEKALAGEQAKIQALQRDPFLRGPEWVAQRQQRDPFHRGHVYRGSDPRLDELFAGVEGRGTLTEDLYR